MNSRPVLSIFFLICQIFFSTISWAQDYLAESDFFGETPTILTVSRMHKPLADTPASVSVIDRQMIRNSGAREIADIFRMVPGMVVGYLLGHTPTVTYHGLGQEFHRQLQVLIDGRSVFIPSFGGVPWSNLPLLIEDIERIEITRGPNAVTYGSNAFLTTINIITRHAAEDVGGKISGTHYLDKDSNIRDLYVRYGNQVEDLDWRISAGRESDDGFSEKRVNDGFTISNDSKTLEKLNIRADFLSSHNQFWSVQAGINQSVTGYGNGTGSGDATDIFRDADTSNYFQNIKWELVEPDVQSTIKLTHTRHNFDDNFVAQNIPGLPATATVDIIFDRLSERTDLEIYQNRVINDALSINYGASIRQDRVQSIFLFNDSNKYKVDTKNLFSSAEWKPLDSTTVDLGFLIEDSNIIDKETSYRISLIQKIQQHHLRVVTSTAKRHPVLWELTGEIAFSADFPAGSPPPFDQPITAEIQWLNNNTVTPESIRSNEIGLLSEFMDRQLTTDIKLFSYKISNQIAEEEFTFSPPLLTGDDSAATIVNGGETTVDGIELSFNFSPRNKQYRLYGGLSQKNAKSFEQDLADSFPDRTTFLGGHYDISSRHQLSATAYYVDNMSWIDRTVQLDSFTTLDARYQYLVDQKNEIKLEFIGYGVDGNYNDYRNSEEHKPTYVLRVSGRF